MPTVEAEKRLIASGKSAKRKQEIDQAAAAVILETVLDNPLIDLKTVHH